MFCDCDFSIISDNCIYISVYYASTNKNMLRENYLDSVTKGVFSPGKN